MAKRNVWSERKMGPKKEHVGLGIENSLQKRRQWPERRRKMKECSVLKTKTESLSKR